MNGQALQEYLQLLEQRGPEYTCDEVIEPVQDPLLLEKYSRETGMKLGIRYRGVRHILVVDLVRHRDGTLHPYERLLKTVTGSSVVIVPHRGEKLVLLKQFRHALGDYQYCFPRGFAEEGLQPAENAKKEISEELGCECTDLQLLGRMVADSGICGEPVWVYGCQVDQPAVAQFYENITGCIEVTVEEITQMVRDGKINDGFTLSAMTLLNAKT